MWTNRNFTNVFTCPFLIIYAFCHNLQTFFYKHDCFKIFMLLKKYPQQTIYLQYKIFISYISENTITYETKCMNFSYIVTIKVIKKIIFVFVTAINSAVLNPITLNIICFSSYLAMFTISLLWNWLWQFLRDQVYDSQPFSGSLLRKVNFY